MADSIQSLQTLWTTTLVLGAYLSPGKTEILSNRMTIGLLISVCTSLFMAWPNSIALQCWQIWLSMPLSNILWSRKAIQPLRLFSWVTNWHTKSQRSGLFRNSMAMLCCHVLIWTCGRQAYNILISIPLRKTWSRWWEPLWQQVLSRFLIHWQLHLAITISTRVMSLVRLLLLADRTTITNEERRGLLFFRTGSGKASVQHLVQHLVSIEVVEDGQVLVWT